MNRLRLLAVRAATLLGAVAAPSLAQEPSGSLAPKSFWLPARETADAFPAEIDRLFNLILWITGVTMVAVFLILLGFLLKYRAKPGAKAYYTHGSHKVEIVWTIAPALILLWLALIQANTWLDIKAPERMPRPNEATVVRVIAQQFAWNFRQAGLDGTFERFNAERFEEAYGEWRTEAEKEAAEYLRKREEAVKNKIDPNTILTRLPTAKPFLDSEGNEIDIENPIVKPNVLAEEFWSAHDDDDIVSSGEMVVPVDRPVLIDLRSVDVLHSFYLPHFRLKQDAVPGKPMPVWFRPTKVGSYEIACAELCGSLHTSMKATLKVVSREEYDQYVAKMSGAKAGKVTRTASKGNDNVWRAWGAQDKQIIEARLR
jgi:heme/copper-type cytochrome/quinol oxidase subunit 2